MYLAQQHQGHPQLSGASHLCVRDQSQLHVAAGEEDCGVFQQGGACQGCVRAYQGPSGMCVKFYSSLSSLPFLPPFPPSLSSLPLPPSSPSLSSLSSLPLLPPSPLSLSSFPLLPLTLSFLPPLSSLPFLLSPLPLSYLPPSCHFTIRYYERPTFVSSLPFSHHHLPLPFLPFPPLLHRLLN